LANWGKENLALVVVWDGGLPAAAPSADDRLLFKHLTPLDWALAYSSRVLGTDKLKIHATFAIVIVDLTWQRDADHWSTRMRYQLLADMPWVTLCAPLPFLVDGGTRDGLRLCLPILDTANEAATHQSPALQVRNAASLLGRAKDGKWRIVDTAIAATLAKAPAGGAGVRLQELGRQWAASLGQVDEHHDLNNIVGPYLIADLVGLARPEELCDAKSPVEPFLIDAFLTRLNWSGLMRARDDATAARFEYEAPKVEGNLKVLAVDDRLDVWGGVLAFLLGVRATSTTPSERIQRIGASEHVDLFGTNGPDALLESLGISETDQGADIDLDRYRRRIYDSPIGNSDDVPWALVLDLRLFAGKPDRAHKWYWTLAHAAKSLCSIEPEELAWPGFEVDLDSLERWLSPIDGTRIDPRAPSEQPLALSLLARLCALRWPCTPILLFSSTSRREIVDRFAPYGNIFLAGAKPALLDVAPREKCEAFFNSWLTEFCSAQRLVMVQQRIVNLHKANRALPARNLAAKRYHVTIALDETGDFEHAEYSAIGGICLVTTGEDDREAIRQGFIFSEALRQSGISFYERRPFYTDHRQVGCELPGGKTLSKRDPIAYGLNSTLKRFSNSANLGVVRYCIPKSQYIEGGSAHHAGYLSGITRLLSLIIIELLPSMGVVPGANCTLSIWIPQKQANHFDKSLLEAAVSQRLAAEGHAASSPVTAMIAASDFKRQVTVQEEARLMPNAIASARDFAGRYDLRVTSFERSTVETIGGYGVALALLSRAIGLRSEYPSVFSAIVSLKARKLPYRYKNRDLEYERATDWVCPSCFSFFQCFDLSPGRPNPTCPSPSCSKSDTAADYSVLAHCADALLSVESFCKEPSALAALSDGFSIDLTADERLVDFLHASQLWDQRRESDSFLLAYRHKFFAGGVSEVQRGPVHGRLLSKLTEYSASVKGFTLSEMSGLRPRGLPTYDSENVGSSVLQRDSPDALPADSNTERRHGLKNAMSSTGSAFDPASESSSNVQVEPGQPGPAGSPLPRANPMAVPASAPPQSGACAPTADQALLLTVSGTQGPLFVLDGEGGIQYAMPRRFAELSIGQVVSCVANGGKADIKTNGGMRQVSIVVLV
jgi:hypothetical protein